MEIKSFGTMRSGEKIDSITLKNAAGTELELLNIGAVIRSLKVRDREGNLRDVVLGYDSVDRYEKNYAFFGATVGRYANRIASGTFELNGKTYSVPVWRGKGVSLHCLPDTYSFRFWNYEAVREQDGECVTFYLDSPDGDQGLPGNLFFAVTYHLTDDNEVILEYYAESDADTLLNPTNHTYFNLSGHASGNVLNHTLKILSDEIPVYDDAICPIGSFEKIGGTAYDFQTEKTIGQDVRAKVRGITENYGYDVAYVVNGGKKIEESRYIGTLASPDSGISMEVYTDMPAVQLYTANRMRIDNAKDDASYRNYGGCCLETGFVANGINIGLEENAVLKAGEPFSSVTVYRFLTEER